MLIKLIYINLFVFLACIFINLPFWLMDFSGNADQFVNKWFGVPSDLGKLIQKPWTLFTYMFIHSGLWHLVGNLLWLYVFGQLFMQFLGERKLLTVYIAGGLAGAILFIVFYNVFPVFEAYTSKSVTVGASAAVMAIVVGVSAYTPNTIIRLFILGDVKLKYIALVAFLLDVIRMSDGNSGGHIAHIGGAALGLVFAKQWLKGNDITAWIGSTIDYFSSFSNPLKKRSKMKVKYKSENTKNYDYRARKKEEQAEVDAILDKISKSGYDSLSKREKEILFKASGK